MEKDKSKVTQEENADKKKLPDVINYPFPVHIRPRNTMAAFIKRVFTFWSAAVGVAIVTLGSFLLYFYTDQIQYKNDYFKYSLLVTSVAFTIIGVLLIMSAVMKLLGTYTKKSGYHKHAKDIVENGPQSSVLLADNTIVYDPLNPPILIPYMANTESVNYYQNQFIPGSNSFYMPGGLFFGEENYGFKANDSEIFPDSITEKKKSDIYVVDEGMQNKFSSPLAALEDEEPDDVQEDINNSSEDSTEEKDLVERY